jgi:hypothetical protein
VSERARGVCFDGASRLRPAVQTKQKAASRTINPAARSVRFRHKTLSRRCDAVCLT